MCRDLAIKPNSTSWAKSVRHLLQSIGFINVWINQVFGNVNLLIRILKELNDNLELRIDIIFACQIICTIL